MINEQLRARLTHNEKVGTAQRSLPERTAEIAVPPHGPCTPAAALGGPSTHRRILALAVPGSRHRSLAFAISSVFLYAPRAVRPGGSCLSFPCAHLACLTRTVPPRGGAGTLSTLSRGQNPTVQSLLAPVHWAHLLFNIILTFRGRKSIWFNRA